MPDRIESSACCNSQADRVFVGCYDGNLYCLHASQGTILWKYQTADVIKSSPVCSARNVFCGSHDKNLYCLDIGSGELIWKSQFSQGSVFSSPAYHAGYDIVIAASLDGKCAAFDAFSGRQKWTRAFDKPIFSSLRTFDDKLLIGCVDGTMYCSCILTGERVWQVATAGPIFSTPSIICAEMTRIVFGSHDHHVYCVDGCGVQLWKFDCQSPVYASPFVSSFASRPNVTCCSTNGLLFVHDLLSGNQLVRTQIDGQVFSSPLFNRGSIVVGCRDDYLYCFRLRT